MVADGAIFNLPHPVLSDRSNQHAQPRLGWNRFVNVDSHKLVLNQLVSCELCQASAMDLTNTNNHPSLKHISPYRHLCAACLWAQLPELNNCCLTWWPSKLGLAKVGFFRFYRKHKTGKVQNVDFKGF